MGINLFKFSEATIWALIYLNLIGYYMCISLFKFGWATILALLY